MNARCKLRASLAAAALAAAVPAVAAEAVTVYTVPADELPATTTYYSAPSTATTYYYVPSTETYYYVPATTEVYTEAPITVYADRATDDQRITDDVGFAIASDPRISGTIGVDTFNRDVTLTGRVGTTVQKDWADQDAKGVDGVRDVNNYLRPRVGES
jgi:hypothetical protein